MKSILLADNQSIVRTGIKTLIKENFLVSKIDEAENEHEVVQCVKTNFYDLVVLDISLPDTDFVQLMGWLHTITPATRVLIFTMHTEDIYGIRCFQLGAWGFLRKTDPVEDVITAIRRIAEGKKYVSPELAELLSNNTYERTMTNPLQHLSSRELEIAMLINKGKTLPQICDVLNIQYSTVNTHKRKIFEKLMVNNVLSLSRLMQTFNLAVLTFAGILMESGEINIAACTFINSV